MSMRTIRFPILGVLVLLLCTGGYLFYEKYLRPVTVDREEDGRAINKVITARLETMGDLRVTRLRGTVQGVSYDQRGGGLLTSTFIMKAPFEASYFVALSKLDRGDFFWDEKQRTLMVEVPDVRLDSINIDEAHATLTRTSGIFVTRDAMTQLRKRASLGAERVARADAVAPKHLARARDDGRAAIAALFTLPLGIAGIHATVRVRFAGEPDRDDEQWDRSRSLVELFATGR